jgi:hypothetical protein
VVVRTTTMEHCGGYAGPAPGAVLAAIFRQILDGERDPELGTGLDDPTMRAVVATVLHHIGS